MMISISDDTECVECGDPVPYAIEIKRMVPLCAECTLYVKSDRYGQPVTAVGSTFTVQYYPERGTFTVSDGES